MRVLLSHAGKSAAAGKKESVPVRLTSTPLGSALSSTSTGRCASGNPSQLNSANWRQLQPWRCTLVSCSHLSRGPDSQIFSSELGWPTPLSVPLSPAAGWGVPGRQPLLPRPASATPGHPPPFSAGWGVSGSQPLSPRPASATPGHSPPLQLAGVSLAARPSHLGQLVPLLGILLLQCRHPRSSPSFNSRNACVQ